MKDYIVEYVIKHTTKTPQYEGKLRYGFMEHPDKKTETSICYDILNMLGFHDKHGSLKLVNLKIYKEKSWINV